MQLRASGLILQNWGYDMSECWKCEKCGHTNCCVDECTTCHGKGIKRKVKEEKLKTVLNELGRSDKPCME